MEEGRLEDADEVVLKGTPPAAAPDMEAMVGVVVAVVIEGPDEEANWTGGGRKPSGGGGKRPPTELGAWEDLRLSWPSEGGAPGWLTRGFLRRVFIPSGGGGGPPPSPPCQAGGGMSLRRRNPRSLAGPTAG